MTDTRSHASDAPADVVVRAARESDLAEVVLIEQQSFSDPWSPASFRQLFGHPLGYFVVAEDRAASRVVGYVVAWFVVDEGEIANLAVSREARRRGVGGRLLDAALETAGTRGCHAVYLEVRESNRDARALYERHGFEIVRRRARYYHRPVEDALVMRRVL